jgi:hypothetical protein
MEAHRVSAPVAKRDHAQIIYIKWSSLARGAIGGATGCLNTKAARLGTASDDLYIEADRPAKSDRCPPLRVVMPPNNFGDAGFYRGRAARLGRCVRSGTATAREPCGWRVGLRPAASSNRPPNLLARVLDALVAWWPT